MFAIAFWAEALNRTALALTVDRNEAAPQLYLVRVFGYALIVAAIIDKNRSKAGR